MKYRIVKDIDNMSCPSKTTYNIEKRSRFLFWVWWDRNYLRIGLIYSGHYTFDNYDKALNCLRILNGEKPRIHKIIFPESITSALKEESPICLNCGGHVRPVMGASHIWVHLGNLSVRCREGNTTVSPNIRETSQSVTLGASDLAKLGMNPPGLTVKEMLKQINVCLKHGFIKNDDMVLLAEPGKETYIVLSLAAPSLLLSNKYNYKNIHLVFGKYEKQQSTNLKERSPMRKTK